MIHLSIIPHKTQAVKVLFEKSDEKTTLGTQGAVCGFTHSEVNIAVQKHLEIDLL